ncbi:MAG: hypothetical protein OEQ18_07100 [Gammaproteobacteria bacterium]|nr:hypothetical protein [Gammaproteobacteria bacterium]
MHASWNEFADDNWATIGPRKLEFDTLQSGTVVNPTRRTFVSAIPLESDYAKITLTKRGGRSTTQIAVCSHGPDGDTRVEHSTIITGDRPDGYQWSPPELEGMLDRLISIQIQPTSAARQLGYVLQVNKGPLVEPVEEEQPSSSPPAEEPSADNISLPGGPTQGVQLPTSPVSLPGSESSSGGPTPGASDSVPAATGSVPADASAAAGQCLVTTTRRFPEIKLRCGLSVRDESARISEDFLADCPLIAGDTVNVEIDEQQREIRITGRASGSEWCSTSYPPGYYTGPCFSERTDASTTRTLTYFYQGRKIIETVTPQTCDPARLEPGTYRVITETRVNNPDQRSKLEIQEAGLRLEGDEMIGDVTGLLSEPITQK